MTAKTLTLLLLCATTLTQAAQWETLVKPRSDFPCPEALDIAPCVCTQDGTNLNLDCSNIGSDAELESVFKKPFPFPDFTRLTIMANPEEPRINIVTLSENVFQNVTFANIHISHTNLELIHTKAFDKSAPMLETLIVTDSFLVIFPFDVVNYSPFLTDLRVFRNRLAHMPEMASDTLTFLEIAYNPELKYGDHALRLLQNLEYFVANDIELSHVGENAFYQNKNIKYVDLSHNKLETLYVGSLNFDSPSIEEISLDNNNINTVEVGAISGLGVGSKTFLWMHNNNITDLPQIVWEPIFNSVIGKVRNFVFDGNPLECSCNILWLVDNADHRDTIARGTICANTDTDILDVDVDFLNENCAPRFS